MKNKEDSKGMNLIDEIKYVNRLLENLKGKKLQLKVGDKVLLEKINPTAEEIYEALWRG